MFEDAQELIDAIEGEYGEEMQEQALDFAGQIGLLDQWDAEEESATEQEYINVGRSGVLPRRRDDRSPAHPDRGTGDDRQHRPAGARRDDRPRLYG